MANSSCVVGVNWRLRAAQPQPVCGNRTGNAQADAANCLCIINNNVSYILQTFGAEKRETRNHRATTTILASNEFIGLNPEAEYESASYNGTNFTTTDGQLLFAGQENKIVEYYDEDTMPGVSNFEFE